jgi:hypothetical protein
LQPKRLFVRDFEEIDDVIANANIDLLPQIEMMRIKRVVEIEDPRLDGFEICRLGVRLVFRLLPRLFLAIFVAEEVCRRGSPVAAESSKMNPKMGTMPHRKRSMRRALRKSMPFVWALLIGTLAGGCVAALAVFAAHS